MNENLDQEVGVSAQLLKVTEYIRKDLVTASKWAKFLAIVGFIMCGLIAVLSLFMMIMGGMTPFLGGQLVLMGFIYLIMAIVFIFPALYMLRFSNHIKVAFNSENQGDFELGVENLRSFFKFLGIYTIVILGIYVLIILFSMFTAAAMRL